MASARSAGAPPPPIVIIGITFLHAMASAFCAIRRGDVARHREWMIRMFAIALGIATVRVVGAPIDFFLTLFGIMPADLFVLSVWAGWLLTVGGAECWIRYTRGCSGETLHDVREPVHGD